MPMFQLLGPVRITGAEGSVTPSSRLRRSLLAALLFEAGRLVPSARIADALWEDPPSSVAANLRTQVAGLRLDLDAAEHGASGRITTVRAHVGEGGGYRLRVEADELDVTRFRMLAGAARFNLRAGAVAEAMVQCRRALMLWNGPFGPDVVATAWFASRAAGLEDLRLGVLEDLFCAQLVLGEHQCLLWELQVAVSAAPSRDHLWELLVGTYFLTGDPRSALCTVDRCRAYFRDGLGIDMPAAVAQLQAAVLDRDEHRVHDLVTRMAGRGGGGRG